MPDTTMMTEPDALSTPAPEYESPELAEQAATRAHSLVEIERAVIGAAMASQQRAEWLLSQITTPSYFTDQRHQQMWAAVTDLIGRGHPADALTVNRELTNRNGETNPQLDLYVTDTMATCAVVGTDEYYTGQLQADHQRRRADAIRMKAGQLTHPSRDWHAAHESGESPLDQIISDFQAVQADTDTVEMSTAGNRTDLDDLLDTWGTQPEGAFDIGLPDVDAALNVVPGSVVVVGAYTGVGKSTLASQAARHSIAKGFPAVQFSAEMSTTQLRQRDLCALARVHLSTTTGNRELTPEDRTLLREWSDKYHQDSEEVGYYLEKVSSMTVNHIRARLSWIKRQHGQIGVVVVDYLQLMQLESGDAVHERTEATTRALKQLAGEMDCVILLLSQCRKPEEKGVPRPPTKWDLSGAASIGNDADAVILLHDPCPKSLPADELTPSAVERRGEVDLIIAKNRSGPEHTVVVSDMRHYAHFAACIDE